MAFIFEIDDIFINYSKEVTCHFCVNQARVMVEICKTTNSGLENSNMASISKIGHIHIYIYIYAMGVFMYHYNRGRFLPQTFFRLFLQNGNKNR